MILGFFLIFMGIGSVVSKGIYKSSIAKVKVENPQGKTIAHNIKETGTIKAGMEHAVFVTPGLRIKTVQIYAGYNFHEGDDLFQVDCVDLQNIIDEKERDLKVAKLELSAITAEEKKNNINLDNEITRAQTNYQTVLADQERNLDRKQQDYTDAQNELTAFFEYLKENVALVNGYSEENKEKRKQLENTVTICKRAYEDAVAEKDEKVKAAEEAVNDASLNKQYSTTSGSQEKNIAVAAQKQELENLKNILAQDGWIQADISGYVLECKANIGERTTESASLIYAVSNEQRVLQATFSEEETKYVAIGDTFEMSTQLPTGEMFVENLVIDYLTAQDDKTVKLEIPIENEEVLYGQSATIEMTKQSELYDLCIPISCLYKDEYENNYVYVLENSNGFYGAEYCATKVQVDVRDQNSIDAAIESSLITEDTSIITQTSKKLSDGAVVRLME